MAAIALFKLGEEVVTERKKYLEITSADEKRLREAHPHLQRHAREIIDQFYDYLLGQRRTREILSAPGLIERLKGLQTRYFEELTSGDYGLSYFENRVRVGQTHHRIGLPPELYLGAYVKYLHIVSDVLSQAFGRDQERFYQTMVSLTKIIYLDMGLALDAYYYSAQATKQQLTDMIVHDLQNPLAGVVAVLQTFASKQGSLSGGEHEALEEALRRCDDLSQMIMNVLQVSRADSGKLEAYFENCDLALIAREVSGAFQRTAEREGRSIKVEAPATLPRKVDQSLLRRILQNLLRNALRHTPKGTSVLVRLDYTEEKRVNLSVEDDGTGISPEVQPLLFEPFGTAALRGIGLRVDTGLGLASCKVAARAMGADLVVRSDGKRGTTFTLTLP